MATREIRWSNGAAQKAAVDHYRAWALRLDADYITALAKGDDDLATRCIVHAGIARSAAMREARLKDPERYP